MQPPSSPPPGGGYEPLRPNGAHGPPPAPGYAPQQQPGFAPPPPPGYGHPPGAQYAPVYAPQGAPYNPYGVPPKKRPGAVVAIRIIMFVLASVPLLFGLILTGLGLGVFFSYEFAVDMDMESDRTVMLIIGAVILAIGLFHLWLGFRAGKPGKAFMWTLVVVSCIPIPFNLLLTNPIGLGASVAIIVLAVSGNGRVFYEGRWAPYYQS
ncbi:hypothetical protein O4J56_03595 [Nocardiopsis sp. RSe5-2]|uniref:Integral membrane protein n=1 Tax=Nocardiopsis endophytica TaxID=3018445 RepID=A0ABT4TYE5_9ACTN|nr:hypothetical protein [Nocardiopsis endophytica]MDA2809717.1 hypothetical protein [Nocardiopsis endophytica]